MLKCLPLNKWASDFAYHEGFNPPPPGISKGEQILNAAQECFTETILFQPDGSKGDEAEGGSREGWNTAITANYDMSTDDHGDN
jgi:hypothetical protein